MSPVSLFSGVGIELIADSSPLNCADSHCASRSPPVTVGSASGSLRRRSASLREPAVISGIGGSMRSSRPLRFRSFLSFSCQSMSFSVLSIFSSCRAEDAMTMPLPMHEIRFVHVDGFAMVEERDEDGEPDRGFRGSDRHHEKDEDE